MDEILAEVEARAWRESPEGKAEWAVVEAKREAERAEKQRKHELEMTERDDRARQSYELVASGVVPGMVPSSGDPISDVRRLVAAASASDHALAPRFAVTREGTSWDHRKDGDVPYIGVFGLLFVHKGQRLVEMRANSCPDHAATLADVRKTEPDLPDWVFCSSGCGARIHLAPIRNWRQLKSYFERSTWKAYRWGGALIHQRYKWAGRRWRVVRIPDEAWRLAMADNFWPGCWPLWGIASPPVLRKDGSVILASGYDRSEGVWLASPGSGQGALPRSMTRKLVEFARQEPLPVATSQLAALTGWPGTPRGLTAYLRKIEDELDAHNVVVERCGRVGENRLPGLIVRLKKMPPISSTSRAATSG